MKKKEPVHRVEIRVPISILRKMDCYVACRPKYMSRIAFIVKSMQFYLDSFETQYPENT